jgi:DNA-binding response OmpR family regulator
MTTERGNLIFLMEDEEDIARLIVHLLEKSGFRVHRPDRSKVSAGGLHLGSHAARSQRIPALLQHPGK